MAMRSRRLKSPIAAPPRRNLGLETICASISAQDRLGCVEVEQPAGFQHARDLDRRLPEKGRVLETGRGHAHVEAGIGEGQRHRIVQDDIDTRRHCEIDADIVGPRRRQAAQTAVDVRRPHFENAQRLTIAEVGFKKQLRVGQGGIMHRIVFPRRSNDPRTVPRDAVDAFAYVVAPRRLQAAVHTCVR